ncbi:MAG: hypothetical protein EU529_05645 [Promethearchaeota archaeon]|nr:MAG: hypothetical protein EU529_05645 [Candidatus Lokiarchaeota archaeon]
MLIEEIGIVCRGFVLYRKNFQEEISEIQDFKKGAFFSAINSFSKSLFSEELSYIEATNHITFFSITRIESIEEEYYEDLIAYAIFNIKNRKKTEKIITKKIKPILDDVLKKFKDKYNRKSLVYVDQYEDFNTELEIVLKH